MKNSATDFKNKIDIKKLPEHVAIIMDGNGRWAKNKNMPRTYGHFEGTKRVVDIVRSASNLGIKNLTLFAFSTENWNRPESEVNRLMELVIIFIDKYIEELNEKNVILKIFGEYKVMPENVVKKLEYAKNLTKDNDGMILNICLNYGGKQEILRAAKNFAKASKDLDDEKIDSIDESYFESFLYSKDQKPVDLLIRTGGELRISNFLLYQSAYAEMYFTDCMWPDFNENEFCKSIVEFQSRNRRFGGV